ncbi:hypothetical protein JCM11641_003636 [Rhodosporidiobolus odoratus]
MSDQRWYLCVDGGGTGCRAVVKSSTGHMGRSEGGPCNVKSVGPRVAISTILEAVQAALHDAGFPSALPSGFFNRAWLGLAGVLHQADVDAFMPFVCEAFGFKLGDSAVKITNDGHLLASPCLSLPHVDSTVAIVAGTGSVGLAFRQKGSQVELVGRRGGWGYLLGDEGSAYTVSRLAITRLLAADDARISSCLSEPSSTPPPVLPLFSALLDHLGVPDAAALIDKTYSEHAPHSTSSRSNPPSFTSSETRRKIWIADAARVIFSFAYDNRTDADETSQAVALSVLEEAMAPLVETVIKLVGDRKVVVPEKVVLALGGGMWKSKGYRTLMVEGLRGKGIEFAEVRVVESAADEGVEALLAQAERLQ